MKELDFRLHILPLKDTVFRIALRLTLSQEEAEDITQDILLRLWERRETLTDIRSLPAYATTMAQRLSLDRLGKTSATHRSLTEIDEQTFPSHAPNAQEQLEQTQRRQWVKELIQQLPEKQRTALLLREVDELSYAAIAEQMNISESDAKVTLHRARQSLRAALLKLERNGL